MIRRDEDHVFITSNEIWGSDSGADHFGGSDWPSIKRATSPQCAMISLSDNNWWLLLKPFDIIKDQFRLHHRPILRTTSDMPLEIEAPTIKFTSVVRANFKAVHPQANTWATPLSSIFSELGQLSLDSLASLWFQFRICAKVLSYVTAYEEA